MNLRLKSIHPTVILAIAISLLAGVFGSRIVQAQRPPDTGPNLLSRSCDSRYTRIFESTSEVSIGRELFDTIFYISSYNSREPGYLTCNLLSPNSGAESPSHIKLQFGLADSARSNTRVSVTAYVDGQTWGSVMLAPRQQAQVWILEVQDARSISIEVECVESCFNNWNDYLGQSVYFIEADLEYIGSSTLRTNRMTFAKH